MEPTNPLPAALATFLALIVCLFLVKKFGPPDEQGRFLAIDGLRGYLAFCVFLHHSIIWYFYLKTDRWEVPPSNLYTHFGQTGVAFFFMITGFLFFSKIIDGKTKEIDWLRLYVSRFLRLMPLYFMAMSILLIIVFALAEFELRDPIKSLSLEVIRWMSFTILGAPDINGIEKTWLILAGVTWSLPYEWFFYLLLPAFALVNRVRVGWIYVTFSIGALILILTKGTSPYHWLSFAGGISAAYVVRSDYICGILRKRIASFLAILLVTLTVALYPTAYGLVQISMLSVAFVIIASGNGILGLLTNQLSRTLGEMAYSIYLLHGLLLFFVFRFVVGFEKAKELTPIHHWLLIIGISPFLILIAFLCYRFIEHPALLKTNALTIWMRKKMNIKSEALTHNLSSNDVR